MSHHYLQFKDVHFKYPQGEEILRGVNFKITHGEHVALLGLNGSGKSTLLRHCNGLLFPCKGEVIMGDIPVTQKTASLVRQSVGLVFQNPDDMLFMPTISDDVAFGPRNMKLPAEEVERRVVKTLSDAGLLAYRDRPAFQLSGGQRRGAAIASVLAMEPTILVLDEPGASLDELARQELIRTLIAFDHTMLLCTHDFGLALQTCQRALVLKNGVIAHDFPLTATTTAHQLAECILDKN